MSDLERFLRQGVGGFDPSPEDGLETTRRRVESRQRRRRFLAGTVTVAMFGGTLAGAAFLGDRSGRPIAGPTPTPSPVTSVETRTGPSLAPAPHPALGTDTCQGPARGDFCVKATSDVLVVGSGETNGVAWALYAWTGTYVGPDWPKEQLAVGPPDVEIPVLCTAWFFGELRQPNCWATADPHGYFWRALVEMPGRQSGAFMQRGTSTFVVDPYFGIQGITAVWSWTPAETAGVAFEGPDGRTFQAELFGPVPQLRNGMKWFVAFVPVDAGPLTARAVDQDDGELWRVDDPPIVSEPPPRQRLTANSPRVTVAEGTFEGGVWELLAWMAVEERTGTEHLCLLVYLPSEDDSPGPSCTQLSGPDPLAAGAMGLDADGGGPLPGFVYGYTSTETARVEISEGGKVSEASLYPSPDELGIDARFFVGFTPREADVIIRVHDSGGELLWSDEHPHHPE